MTATAIAPAAIAGEAHAVLHLALGLTWPEDRETGRAIGRAVWDLHDALETFRLLDGGALHWEAVFPHLSDAADPDGEALAKAAAEAEDAAWVLVQLIAAHCSAEAASLTGAAQ